MSFQSDEDAGVDAIDLYRFTFGDDLWTFTDTDHDVPFNGDVYTPEAISHGNLQQSDEQSSMTLDVKVPALNPVADFFRTPFLPGRQVWLTVYTTHLGSGDPPAIRFRGSVGQCTFDGAQATLNCLPLSRAISRSIPIQLMQRLCTNTLYDGLCQADPDAFRVDRTIVSIVGLTITLDAPTGHPAEYFDGGFINSVKDYPATIRKDPGDGTLILMYNPGWAEGDAIAIFAGCDKRYITCVAKFHNGPHFQGFPFMPDDDPFADEVV
jgi:uncharacterized phage protein (TIGR02218 family)